MNNIPNTLNDLEEMAKFLETYVYLDWIMEKKQNLNRIIMCKKTVSVGENSF